MSGQTIDPGFLDAFPNDPKLQFWGLVRWAGDRQAGPPNLKTTNFFNLLLKDTAQSSGKEQLALDDMAEHDTQDLDGDPRIALTQWANKSDEWIRRIVRQVLNSSGQVSEAELAQIYQLLKEGKGIEGRVAAPPAGPNSCPPTLSPRPWRSRTESSCSTPGWNT